MVVGKKLGKLSYNITPSLFDKYEIFCGPTCLTVIVSPLKRAVNETFLLGDDTGGSGGAIGFLWNWFNF